MYLIAANHILTSLQKSGWNLDQNITNRGFSFELLWPWETWERIIIHIIWSLESVKCPWYKYRNAILYFQSVHFEDGMCLHATTTPGLFAFHDFLTKSLCSVISKWNCLFISNSVYTFGWIWAKSIWCPPREVFFICIFIVDYGHNVRCTDVSQTTVECCEIDSMLYFKGSWRAC